MTRRGIFHDDGPTLSPSERRAAARAARNAAWEAKHSLWLTARRQYRRYRSRVGPRFMAWPEWRAHYDASINNTDLQFPGAAPESRWNGVAGNLTN